MHKKKAVAVFVCIVLIINILLGVFVRTFRNDYEVGVKDVPREIYTTANGLQTPEESIVQKFKPQKNYLKYIEIKLMTNYIVEDCLVVLSLVDENGNSIAQKEFESAELANWGYHKFEIEKKVKTSQTYSVVLQQPQRPIEDGKDGGWFPFLAVQHVPGNENYYLHNDEQIAGELDMIYCYEVNNMGLVWLLMLFNIGAIWIVLPGIPGIRSLQQVMRNAVGNNRNRKRIGEECVVGSGRKTFAWIITCIMSISLAVWPFGLAAIRTALLLEKTSYQAVMVCMLLGFVGIVAAGYKFCGSMCTANRNRVYFILFSTAFFSRVFVSLILQAEPVSDFLTCYDYAVTGTGYGAYLAQFPYLGMYALTLRGWFGLTGTASVLLAQILNALITSFIPIIIYKIVFEMMGKENAAFVGAVTYALFPDMIIYTSIPSCEHFSQFFLILSIYLFVLMKKEKKLKTQYLYCIAVGISLALMHAYKQLLLVVMPALLMANICYELIPAITQAIKTKNRDFHKILNVVIRSAIIVIVTVVCSRIIIYGVQITFVDEIPQGSEDYIVTIYRGLAKEGGGIWNADVLIHAKEVIANAESQKEVWETLLLELKEDYQNDFGAFKTLMLNKFDITWGASTNYYGWAVTSSQHALQGSAVGHFLFSDFPAAFWACLCAVTSLGLLIRLFKKHSDLDNHVWFVMSGCVFLFAIVSLMLEAQKRYVSSFLPVICVMFAMSFDQVVKLLGVITRKAKGYIQLIRGETSLENICEDK